MKKRTKLARAAAAAMLAGMLLLAACGQKPEDPGSKPAAASNVAEPAGKADSGASKPAESAKPMAGADVFAKTMEATAKLDSFTVTMNTKQNIDQGATKMDIQSKIDMDVIMKPQMSFKQAMTMNMQGQEMKMDMYMTKDGFFMKESATGQWMKLPKAQMDQMMSMISDEQLDPSKQFAKLKQFANDFTITESGGDYNVKLSANGEKFNDFIKNEIKGSMGNDPAMGEMLTQSMSAMNIKNMEYTFTVDKKTYYPKSMKMNMDLEMDNQGQKMRLVQNIDGTYSNYNSVKEIVVPKEALDAKPVGAM
jgi:hypothetical protein